MSGKATRRLATLFGLGLLLGGSGLACPAKDLSIDVTLNGIALPGLSCQSDELGCLSIKERRLCNADLACRWDDASGACQVDEKCGRAGNPSWGTFKPKAIRVLLFGQNPLSRKAASPCVPLLPSREEACRDPAGKARLACATQAINAAIGQAIGGGLTYDGFTDQADAFPVIAVYQPRELADACLGGLETPSCRAVELRCLTDDLVACAGLAVPINRESYDITCASCQNGPRFSIGVDTGPCPRVDNQCFFNACAAVLEGEKKGGGG